MERRCQGEVPKKHHIVFKGPDGALRWEECLTRQGFEGAYSLLYHTHRPHEAVPTEAEHGWKAPVAAPDRLLRRHFQTQDYPRLGGAPVDAHRALAFNDDVTLHHVTPDTEDPVYVSNTDADDLYWVFEGGGVLRSVFGDLPFTKGDYVHVPRGVLHRFIPDGSPQTWLHIECHGGLHLPRQWRNDVGQLRMDAPFCHRDFQAPQFKGPMDEGMRGQVAKRGGVWYGFEHPRSPLDVVGWDGATYPWVFPILCFQPRAGLTHLPPTWHGTFATRGALICSFVPRMVDFHPDAIPCPYPHSSVEMDEFLFYAAGNFTSRKGVGPGSVSLHPAGIPHGPHPGAYEASIGHRETNELAVMLDTYKRLVPTQTALEVEDPAYHASFIE